MKKFLIIALSLVLFVIILSGCGYRHGVEAVFYDDNNVRLIVDDDLIIDVKNVSNPHEAEKDLLRYTKKEGYRSTKIQYKEGLIPEFDTDVIYTHIDYGVGTPASALYDMRSVIEENCKVRLPSRVEYLEVYDQRYDDGWVRLTFGNGELVCDYRPENFTAYTRELGKERFFVMDDELIVVRNIMILEDVKDIPEYSGDGYYWQVETISDEGLLREALEIWLREK